MAAPVVLGVTIRVDGAGQATAEVNRLNQAVNNSGAAAQSTNRNFADMARQTSSLNNILSAFGVTLGLVGLVSFSRDMVRTIATIQNMDLRLQGLTKSTQDYAATQEYLSRVANLHHKDNLLLSSSMSKLLSIEETGVIKRQQSKAILEGMSNAQSKVGATSDNLRDSIIGTTQALGMGTLAWEEIKQVTEPIPGLMNKIAEAAGYTGQSAVGDFKKVVSEGHVTSDMFGRILVGALAQYQGAAEAAGDTLTAKYADISNAWIELARVLEEPVSEALTPVLEAISTSIMNLIADAKELGVALDFIFTQRWNAENLAAADAQMSAIAKKYRADANTGGATGSWDDGKTGSWGDTPGKAGAASIRKEIEANVTTKTNAAKTHQQASRAIAKGMSEEEKAAKSLQRAYENQVSSLLRNLALSTDSSATAAMEYDVTSGALKDLAENQKLYLLQKTAEIENNKITNKAREAEKTSMDALIDKYNQLTLSARDYYALSLTNIGISPDKQGPILAQFDKNTEAEKQKKATEDAAQALAAYSDSLDSVQAKTVDLGSVSSAVFDGALGGINTLAGAFSNMVSAIDENAKSLAELHKQQLLNNATADPELRHENFVKFAAEEAKLTQQNILLYLSGVRQMAGATVSMFKENSTARKTMHAIEVTLGAVEMAMQLKELAVKGAAAILEQGKGDPYTAFVRIAAMTAIVGGIIAAAGGAFSGGGGGATMSDAQKAAANGTGTVLGDNQATSDSVNKTWDLLKSIHAEEYAELRGINSGIQTLQGGIADTITRVFQSSSLKEILVDSSTKSSGIGKYDPILNFLLKGLFSTVSHNVIASGIVTGSKATEDILNGGSIGAKQLSVDAITKKTWFSTSYKYNFIYSELDKNISAAMDTVFHSMGTVMLSLSKELGGDLESKLRAYIIPALSIDLKGLSGEEASKKLNAIISATMDRMAGDIFGGVLAQYQKLGEGMLETAVRIVSEVAVVKDALEVSGLKLADNAIAISDALVQAAGGLEEFQKQFSAYYDKFYTDTEKELRLKYQLADQLNDLSLILPQTREGYRQVIESLDMSNRLDQQRYSLLIKLSSAADRYYAILEANTKKYADAVAQAQQVLASEQDKLTRTQNQAVEAQKALEKAYQDEEKALQSLAVAKANAILDAYKIQEDSLKSSKDQLLSAYKKEADQLTTTIAKFNEFATSLKSFRDSLTIGDLSPSFNNYETARGLFDTTLSAINRGPGSTDESNLLFSNAVGSLQTNAQNFLSSSLKNSATSFDYAKDFARVLNGIDTSLTMVNSSKSTAELQLNALETSVSELVQINESVLSVHDAIMGVQAGVVALNKLQEDRDKAAKIVEEAAAQASAIRAAEQAAAQAAQAVALAAAASQVAAAAAATQAALVAQAEQAAQAAQAAQSSYAAQVAAPVALPEREGQPFAWIQTWEWRNQWRRADQSWFVQNQWQQLYNQENEKGKRDVMTLWNGGTLKGYAKGGKHQGGWRIVGENGPELENTGPSQIFSHSQSKSILSFDELIEEMRRLRETNEKMREEIKIGHATIATNVKESTKQLKNWDIDGLPAERTI